MGACPDPGLIAAHADRRLGGDEAARMDEHISGCPGCYDVFSETLQFALAEAPAPSAITRRPAFSIAAVLAMAAMLFVATGLWFSRGRIGRAPAPLVADLAEAMGTRRLVEPRLTGGFQHGRLVTLRSGEAPQGLDAQPAAVLAAVARIRQRAEGDTSPDALGALGVTYIVSGDVGAAVKALESASAQQPDNARLLSDLAAAYLVRAAQADEPADIPKALETAERAIVLKDAPPEAWFNRALALEQLHLVDAARKAWEDYLQRDSASGWADEARQHLEALPKARQSSVEEDKARVKATLEGGQAAIDQLADEDPSLLRDYFQDDLLPAWADAYLVGHPEANFHRERARLLGDALLRTTSDALPQDAARALAEPAATAASRDPLRSQAVGYRTLREAKHLYDLLSLEPSCLQFREALRDLEAGGSPYAASVRERVVAACLFSSDQKAAMTELDRLETFAQTRGYEQLQGHVLWLQGLIQVYRGNWTTSLERYRSARTRFHLTRDAEGEAIICALLAENLDLLGESRGAWRERGKSLALLDHVRSPRHRYSAFGDAVRACRLESMPRSALHFETSLVDTAMRWSSATAINDALIRRADIYQSLGFEDLAVTDLLESRRWIGQISDRPVAERQQAETNAVEGELLLSRQPAEAARSIGLALDYFRVIAPPRLPALHLLLARAQIARGFDDAAEGDLSAGIETMEKERISLRDAALQVSFFDQALPLFDDMVRFQIAKRHDPERALAFVERGRARQLVDSLAGASVVPLDPEGLRQGLPEGLALVYYLALDDRLLAWTLTRDGTHFVERGLPATQLTRLVVAYRTALETKASLAVVRKAGSHLFDELVRPLAPFLISQRALVVVPDTALQSVPFASLWDRETGRYLVEDYLLCLSPSGTVFVRASTAASATPRGEVPRGLIVGNPRFDRRLWTGLPNLPGAEAEAAEIASLYTHSELLTGSGATKTRFLELIRSSEVVHYAGHAAASAGAPSAARLLFAPDPKTGDSGALFLRELGAQAFPRTHVVILAACRTAAGAVSSVEGALSIGRPFLAAGVPDAVASLWDIDDSTSRRFFTLFHRALLVEGDPFLALRKAQLSLLRSDDASQAHPTTWAAFVCMGGLDRHSFLRGEVS